MKRVIVAAMAACIVWLMASPAVAEHDTYNYFSDTGLKDGTIWDDGDTYCFDGWSVLSSSEESNMKSTANIHVEAIEDNTQFNQNFVNGGDCTNNLSWDTYDQGNPLATCNYILDHTPGMNSRIDYDNLGSGVDGATVTCDLDNNNRLDLFWIIINDCGHRESCAPPACNPNCQGIDNQGFNLFFDGGSGNAVPEKQVDFAGLLKHELVHAIGFQDRNDDFDISHFTSGSGACPDNSGVNTLCYGSWENTYLTYNDVGNVSPGTWARSLESHDTGEISQAY